MRFLMTSIDRNPAPPTPEQAAAIDKFMTELRSSGVLQDSGAIMPLSRGARVRFSGGKFSVLDGPFPETKELIVGFVIVKLPSLKEALELARRFFTAVGGDSEGDIQELFQPDEEVPHH